MSDNNQILAQYATSAPLAARRGLYDTNVGVTLTDRLDEQLQLSSAKSLLDVGCGYGADVATFSKRHPQLQIVGLDQSEGQLRDAQNTTPSAKFILADAENFDLHEKFDRVLIRHVLHLVSSPSAVLERARAHCQPTGRMVVAMHSVKSQPKYRRWISRFKDQTGIDYSFPADTFAIENQTQLFQNDTWRVENFEALEMIHLTSPEPYLDYIKSQTRWSKQPSSQELSMLIEHVRRDIESDITQNGYFEDPSINGIVIVDLA